MIDWGAPITLVGADAEQVALAQRELARIGIDRFAGAATGRPDELAERRPVRVDDLFGNAAEAGVPLTSPS